MRLIDIRLRLAIATAVASVCVAGCGGGAGSLTAFDSYSPLESNLNCVPGADTIGSWKVVANNKTIMPDSPTLPFFSYTQPSVNTAGMVVFRGRAKDSSTSGDAGIQRGIYGAFICPTLFTIRTVADSTTIVPPPNNTSAIFTEFPSIPRIDMNSGVLATRGQSDPVWTLADGTRLGTSGLFITLDTGLTTGVNLLGSVPSYSDMQVPGASAIGIRFDQFPGSPSVASAKFLVFKGNYTDGGSSRTGVYFRDMSVSPSPVKLVANSATQIPGASANSSGTIPVFGSTAPPSAVGNQLVFVGLDNETSPTLGGIYLAPIAEHPTLTPLVEIAKTSVPDKAGNPLAPLAGQTSAPTFTQLGEGLSFDGRYIAFWAAWGTGANNAGMHAITLTCPTDGNQQLRNACIAGSDKDANGQATGKTQVWVPDNQGIFLFDTVNRQGWMIANANNGAGALFQDFLFWTYSGAVPQSGSSGATDAEPPRWRASAFAAVDGARGVMFKGSLATRAGRTSVPASGIYGAAFVSNTIGSVFKLIEVGDAIAPLDAAAPAGSLLTAVAIEREGLRKGWFVLTASSLNAAGESWAGIYSTHFPGKFNVGAVDAVTGLASLALGSAP